MPGGQRRGLGPAVRAVCGRSGAAGPRRPPIGLVPSVSTDDCRLGHGSAFSLVPVRDWDAGPAVGGGSMLPRRGPEDGVRIAGSWPDRVRPPPARRPRSAPPAPRAAVASDCGHLGDPQQPRGDEEQQHGDEPGDDQRDGQREREVHGRRSPSTRSASAADRRPGRPRPAAGRSAGRGRRGPGPAAGGAAAEARAGRRAGRPASRPGPARRPPAPAGRAPGRRPGRAPRWRRRWRSAGRTASGCPPARRRRAGRGTGW